MKTINKKYFIKAPVEKVWQALVDPKEIEKWGGGPAEMSEKEDKEFKLWGGDIYGKNIKVVLNELLDQEWFGGKWEKPSRVIFSLSPVKNGTELSLLHEDVPDEEAEDIDSGWDDYYLGAIKNYLEKSKISN